MKELPKKDIHMNQREIPEIKEAIDLLKSAEKDFPSVASVHHFRNAIEILNDYLEDETIANETVEFIGNLELSYAKMIISRINQVQTKDFPIFIDYLMLFSTTLRNKFKTLCSQYPDLEIQMDKCRDKFKMEIEELFDLIKKN